MWCRWCLRRLIAAGRGLDLLQQRRPVLQWERLLWLDRRRRPHTDSGGFPRRDCERHLYDRGHGPKAISNAGAVVVELYRAQQQHHSGKCSQRANSTATPSGLGPSQAVGGASQHAAAPWAGAAALPALCDGWFQTYPEGGKRRQCQSAVAQLFPCCAMKPSNVEQGGERTERRDPPRSRHARPWMRARDDGVKKGEA